MWQAQKKWKSGSGILKNDLVLNCCSIFWGGPISISQVSRVQTPPPPG